jgi:hypothetical protein
MDTVPEKKSGLSLIRPISMYSKPEPMNVPPGLPDFSWYMLPKPEKMYQTVINYAKCPQNILNYHKISLFYHLRPSKICPNWNFWFEKKPSGNPLSRDKRFRFAEMVRFRLTDKRSLWTFFEHEPSSQKMLGYAIKNVQSMYVHM